MTEHIPDLTPEVADAARDVLALVRTEISGDRQGARAILDTLDLKQAKVLLLMTADLAARMLQERAGDRSEEYLARFAREYLS